MAQALSTVLMDTFLPTLDDKRTLKGKVVGRDIHRRVSTFENIFSNSSSLWARLGGLQPRMLQSIENLIGSFGAKSGQIARGKEMTNEEIKRLDAKRDDKAPWKTWWISLRRKDYE